IVLAGGLSWTPREDLTIDAGYQHLFFDDAPIDKVGSSGDRLVGEFDNAADIVSVGLNWRF
ncbi:MAG: outer membrane protein transport protein, partial [Euryhalocaulis sp.]